MTFRLFFVGNATFFFSVSLISIAIASPPSIEEVKTGIEKHYSSYNDFEFTYNVRSKNPKGEYDETQNTYRLHIPEEGYPWQYLVRRKKSPFDNTLQIEHFSVFNGKETWVYSRSELREGNRSKCAIAAGYSWDTFINDPYSQFLVKSIVGLPFTDMSSHAYDKLWGQQKDAQQFAGKRELDGHDVFIFKRLYGKGRECELHVLGAPHFMVVRMKATDINDKKLLQLIDVEEIGQEEGIVFPKKGHCLRSPYKSDSIEITGIDYSYDVTQVRHLYNVKQAAWFPDIPPGTAVANHITGKNTSLPWSKRQREIIAMQAEALVPIQEY